MSRTQKFAWFNLVIAALATIVVFALVPFLGWQRAYGGMGFLGLTAFGPLFFRKQPGQVVTDERDILIQSRSQLFAHGVVWLIFVFVVVGVAPAIYGWDGAVPVIALQMSVWWAWIIVQGAMSIAILVQYGGGSRDVA